MIEMIEKAPETWLAKGLFTVMCEKILEAPRAQKSDVFSDGFARRAIRTQ
jgi:hypothetical protein